MRVARQAAEGSGIKQGLRSAMRWLQTFPKAPEVVHAVVRGECERHWNEIVSKAG
jgi:hypothetical protein